MTSKTFSPRETADALGTREDFIYKLIYGGRIAATKGDNGRWLIPSEAVEARRRYMEAKRDIDRWK